MRVNNIIRYYHRQISVMMCIPLALTVITGTLYPIFNDWLSLSSVAGVMLGIHSGRLLGLESIYPVLNGLGLIGLMVTGLSMTSLFRKRRFVNVGLPEENGATQKKALDVDKELLKR